MAIGSAKRARVSFLEGALPVSDGIRIIAGSRRHETDAEDTAVRRIAESFHLQALGSAGLAERTADCGVGEWITRIWSCHVHRDFDKIVGFNAFGRLRKRDLPGRSRQYRRERQRQETNTLPRWVVTHYDPSDEKSRVRDRQTIRLWEASKWFSTSSDP